MYLLEVSNPVAQQRGVVTAKSINPRPATLDNKRVGLLWSGTHGGDGNRAANPAITLIDDVLRSPIMSVSNPYDKYQRFPWPKTITIK